LPMAGVNASVRGNIMRTANTMSHATAMTMSPNFSVITSLTMGIHVCFLFPLL